MAAAYKSKFSQFPGSSLEEAIKLARHEYHSIQKRTPKRAAYVRSKYFTKDKVFINNFWDHLNQKSPQDKLRRAKLFLCGIDLLRNTRHAPESMQNPNVQDEVLHRFQGLTNKNQPFCVQLKQNKKTGRLDYISVFPVKPTLK